MVSLVHGLRHFVRWRHPRLLLKELTLGSSAPTFYEASLSLLQHKRHYYQYRDPEDPLRGRIWLCRTHMWP